MIEISGQLAWLLAMWVTPRRAGVANASAKRLWRDRPKSSKRLLSLIDFISIVNKESKQLIVTSFIVLVPTLIHHYSPLNAASVLRLATSSAMALIQQQNDFLKLKRGRCSWICESVKEGRTKRDVRGLRGIMIKSNLRIVRTSHEFQQFFVGQKMIAQ